MTTALLITGTVGAGKTTAAEAVGDLLTERMVPHAVIDLDWLRRAWPSPPGDPFQHQLTVRNLAAVTAGFREAGARRLILAGVVETAAERADYEAATGGHLTVCRLKIDIAAVRARLRHRHQNDPDGLTWHLNRSAELDRVLEEAAVEDLTVDSSGLTPHEIAQEVTVPLVRPAATRGIHPLRDRAVRLFVRPAESSESPAVRPGRRHGPEVLSGCGCPGTAWSRRGRRAT